MNQLDDLPLDPARDSAPVDAVAPSHPSRPSWAPLALIALAVAVLGGIGWYAWQRNRPVPQAAATNAAAAADTPAPAPPPVVLPPLDQMDPFLRALLSGLSTHPQLLAWLATDDLVGSVATAIDRLAQGQSPARDLAPLRPGEAFAVTTRRGVTTLDPRSYGRYDGLAAAVASVDPAKLAEVFRTIEPRLAEAWSRQGHAGSVRDAVQRAAAVVAATPDAPDEISLVPRASGYGYADAELETLPPAQKHLLRMGPANVVRVRQAASAFGAALAAGR